MNSKELENLILLVRQGDKEAEGKLVVLFDKLISSIATNYRNIAGVTLDDLKQEGAMRLIELARSCDMGKRDSIEAYFSRGLNNRFKDIARNANALFNRPINRALPFDANDVEDEDGSSPSATIPSSAPTPEEQLIDRERDEDFYAELRSILSGFEYSVILLYLENISYNDIATRLNTGRKKVDNAIYAAKRKYLIHSGLSLNPKK